MGIQDVPRCQVTFSRFCVAGLIKGSRILEEIRFFVWWSMLLSYLEFQVQHPFTVSDIPENISSAFDSLMDEEPAALPHPPSAASRSEVPVPAAAPTVSDNVKAEETSDSDVEVLLIKPAKKRSRQSSVNVKSEQVEHPPVRLPLDSGAVEQSPTLFCKQGHDLHLVQPVPNWIVNAKEYGYFDVNCDVCGVQISGDSYRCEACDWDVCLQCTRNSRR